jgi:hypothetical protein
MSAATLPFRAFEKADRIQQLTGIQALRSGCMVALGLEWLATPCRAEPDDSGTLFSCAAVVRL